MLVSDLILAPGTDGRTGGRRLGAKSDRFVQTELFRRNLAKKVWGYFIRCFCSGRAFPPAIRITHVRPSVHPLPVSGANGRTEETRIWEKRLLPAGRTKRIPPPSLPPSSPAKGERMLDILSKFQHPLSPKTCASAACLRSLTATHDYRFPLGL